MLHFAVRISHGLSRRSTISSNMNIPYISAMSIPVPIRGYTLVDPRTEGEFGHKFRYDAVADHYDFGTGLAISMPLQHEVMRLREMSLTIARRRYRSALSINVLEGVAEVYMHCSNMWSRHTLTASTICGPVVVPVNTWHSIMTKDGYIVIIEWKIPRAEDLFPEGASEEDWERINVEQFNKLHELVFAHQIA